MREWESYNYDTNARGTGVYILAEAKESLGYEWHTVAIVGRMVELEGGDTKDQFAVYEDSGCSCSYAYEYHPDEYDLEWLDNPRAALIAAIRRIDWADSLKDRESIRSQMKPYIIKNSAQSINGISAGLNERLAKND